MELSPSLMLRALALAAVLPALVLLWNRRSGDWRPWRVSAVLGAGLGFYAGGRVLGMRPQWPTVEDRDRLLLLVFPALLVVELLATLLPWRWARWVLRLPLAGGAACILLHGSVYLTQPPGPDSLGWTPAQQWLILGGLGAALALVWAALAALAAHAPGRSVPAALALSCAAAAIAVMLSGYATAAPIGLLLAVAIVGSVVGSLFLPAPPEPSGILGFGIVGLFSLMIIGRFFGELPSLNAALLVAAPLLGWVPELPYLNRLGARSRGFARLMLTAIPLVLAILLIVGTEKLATVGPGEEPDLDEYRNFGK